MLASKFGGLSEHALWQLLVPLNYIDHRIKLLFSIPLVQKCGSCIALALFQIFTIISPPMIMQLETGSEFHGTALNARQVYF